MTPRRFAAGFVAASMLFAPWVVHGRRRRRRQLLWSIQQALPMRRLRRSRHWALTFLRSQSLFRRGVSGRAHGSRHRRGGHRADSLSPRKVTADDTVLAVDRPAKRYAMAVGADDTGRDLQWGLTRLQAEDLWQRSTGAGITVAVVDSG